MTRIIKPKMVENHFVFTTPFRGLTYIGESAEKVHWVTDGRGDYSVANVVPAGLVCTMEGSLTCIHVQKVADHLKKRT